MNDRLTRRMGKKIGGAVAALAVLLLLGLGQSWAEVNVNVNVGVPLPPAVVVEAPPAMIFLGTPGIYVMVGVPYDIFFISGRYYYFHGGNWFWATGYGGPWVHVVYKSLPPGLRKYKIGKLREFRTQEYKAYKAQGPKFNGKHFVAVVGPGPKAKAVSREHVKEEHFNRGKRGKKD